MTNGHMEAKKHAYRQTQDGVVISFVVHPDDINPALAAAPLGTPYMIGWAEMEPGEQNPKEKPKRTWADMKPSEQAGIACNEIGFQNFLIRQNRNLFVGDKPVAEAAAGAVRAFCGVTSRSELDTNPEAAAKWTALHTQYLRDTGRVPEER